MQLSKPTLVFVGAVVTDVILDVSGNIPFPRGKFRASEILHADALSLTAEDIPEFCRQNFNVTGETKIFGGGGYNAAFAAARLAQIYAFDIDIVLISKFGQGHDATIAKDKLRKVGVHVLDANCQNRNADIHQNYAINGSFNGKPDRMMVVNETPYPDINTGFSDEISNLLQSPNLTGVHIHNRLDDLAIMMSDSFAQNRPSIIAVDASSANPTLDKIMRCATHAVLPDELFDPKIKQDQSQQVMDYMRSFDIHHKHVARDIRPGWYSHQNQPHVEIPTFPVPHGIDLHKVGAGDRMRAATFLFAVAGRHGMTPVTNFEEALVQGNLHSAYLLSYPGEQGFDKLRNNYDDLYHRLGKPVPNNPDAKASYTPLNLAFSS